MERVEYNIETGELKILPLTAEEIDAIDKIKPLAVEFPSLPRSSFWLAALSVGIIKSDVLSHTIVDEKDTPEIKQQKEYMRIMIEEPTFYKRNDPLIDQLAQQFNIKPEELDSLWIWASKN